MTEEDKYWQGLGFIDDLINQLPAAIFWKNTESIFLGCNQFFAEFAGLSSPKEIIGKVDYDLPWGKHESDLYRIDDQEVILSQQPKLGIEESQTLSNGKTVTLLTNKIPLISKENVVVGLLGIFQDITARKEMERSLENAKNQAEAANYAKTEFIANMSHDIRTPLTGIIGMANLLEEGLQNPEEKQYAKWINESGEQLLGLLNGILDVVSTENVNEHVLREEIFDLRHCIHDICQLELPTIKLKALHLRVDIDNAIPQYIVSDRTKLHRILLNLLGNALKFTNTGSVSIEIKLLSSLNEQVKLQFLIVDTGIGIPDALQKNVFDRFFRVCPSYKGMYPGQGVGLHIAQLYAKLLGGEINLTSQVGVGTTFYFDLTFKVVQSIKAPPKHESLSPGQTVETLRIPHLLLVEDNRIALRMAEKIASNAGCYYTSAVDGEHALELAQTMDFDLIVTDIGLPGISGYELTHHIRKWETSLNKKPVPIVGLTAHTQAEAKDTCLQSGMNEIYTKPVNLKTMKEIIYHYMSAADKVPLNISTVYNLDKPSKLGQDLPDEERSLFELEEFPFLDTSGAIESIGSEDLLREMLRLMLYKAIPDDVDAIQNAYEKNDWELVEKLAHKMKGGAVYCGTIKMQYACQYLERYRKAGHSAVLNALYQQLMNVVDETKQHIEKWLHNQYLLCSNSV